MLDFKPHLIRLNVFLSELEMWGYFGEIQNSELVSKNTLQSLMAAQDSFPLSILQKELEGGGGTFRLRLSSVYREQWDVQRMGREE